jgi:hypothetical protein
MLGTEGALAPQPEVAALLHRHPRLLHDTADRRLYDRNMYVFAAQKLGTNIRNHLTINAPKMMKRLL